MKMIIQDYSEEWKRNFDCLAETLYQALDGIAVTIEHIGSTAVPALAAKPIIDIDIVYPKSVSFNSVKQALEQTGYFHNGDQGIEGREVFKRIPRCTFHDTLDSITHHLYVCREDNEELRKHLLFRDYLRKYPEARNEYQQIKMGIASEAQQDRKLYARLKEVSAIAFITDIITKAENVNECPSSSLSRHLSGNG